MITKVKCLYVWTNSLQRMYKNSAEEEYACWYWGLKDQGSAVGFFRSSTMYLSSFQDFTTDKSTSVLVRSKNKGRGGGTPLDLDPPLTMKCWILTFAVNMILNQLVQTPPHRICNETFHPFRSWWWGYWGIFSPTKWLLTL